MHVNAMVGDNVEFLCVSEFPAKWNHNGIALPINTGTGRISGARKRTKLVYLKIASVTEDNSGIYECHGQGAFHFYFVNEAKLSVYSKVLLLFCFIIIRYKSIE